MPNKRSPAKPKAKRVHKVAKRGVSGGFEEKAPDLSVSYDQLRKGARPLSRKSRVKPLTKASGSGRGKQRKSNKGGRAAQRKSGT